MARLRIETAPEITVYDESFVIKAASGASAPLAEFKNSAGTVVGNIAVDGTLNVLSVVTSNAGTTSTSLATRGYVDSLTAGINWHEVANLATAAALPTATYANGTNGVGATLTGDSNGRLTVDGSQVTTGQAILVKNQTNAVHNGIYTVTEQGATSTTAFILTRRADANNSLAGTLKTGDALLVLSGSANSGQGFILTSTGSGTAGEIRATNNVTAFYSSDARLKENVQPIQNALGIVSAVGGKTFDWTDAYIAEHGGADGYFVTKSDFGVIAQDVQAVFPVAVRERGDGTLAVDYEKLVAVAFAAIAELRAEVEALKK